MPKSYWAYPVVAAIVLICWAVMSSSSPSRVPDQGPAVVSSANDVAAPPTSFPPPETTVTVAKKSSRGTEQIAPSSAATPPAVRSSDSGDASAVDTVHPGPSRDPWGFAPPPSSDSTVTAGRDPTSRTATRRRKKRETVAVTPSNDREVVVDTMRADSVDHEAARRTAQTRRRERSTNEDDEVSSVMGRILNSLNEQEVNQLMEGRMTTSEVSGRIHYSGPTRVVRRAIAQIRRF